MNNLNTTPIPIATTTSGQTSPSPTDTLLVIAWNDPVVERSPGAMRADSDDALKWYGACLGPAGTLIMHRLARYATDGPTEWALHELGQTFGLAARHLRHSLNRLHMFGIAHLAGDVLAVRLWLPPLTVRNRVRLPDYLAAEYEARSTTGYALGR